MSLRTRWAGNFALYIIDNLAIRFVFPLMSIGFAFWTLDRGWGILELVTVPHWLAVAVSIVLLDFSKYLQHFFLHHVPLLWRFHKIHHADQDYDFTTGLRFHPGEAIFTVLFLFGSIAILGPPVHRPCFIHETISVVHGLVVHGNVRVPTSLDRLIRFVVITPRRSSDSSFDRCLRVECQFWCPCSLVGSVVGHLSRPARCRSQRHDNRPRWVSRS